MKIIKSCKTFFKHEPVLCICMIIALISMLFVPPSLAYLKYIDLRVLFLLFCLMAVVLGLQECGLFNVLAQKLLTGRKQFRLLSLILVMLPFFCSMFVTNDVALIAFVPFTILALNMINRKETIIRVVVLQTIAANLGSMATPIGNPHDLFLYEYYKLTAGQFIGVLFPLLLVSFVGLCAVSLCSKNDLIEVNFKTKERIREPKKLIMYIVLFVLCLFSVLRIIPYLILTAIVLILMLIFSRNLLKKVDYSLLLTFVCFFVFAGNMGKVPEVRYFLSNMLNRDTQLSAILASQVISNVPSSVLLSGFTSDWKNLLIGVNIGGLGTPIASLASLISIKIYIQSEDAHPLKFLGIFTLYNILGIVILVLTELLLK